MSDLDLFVPPAGYVRRDGGQWPRHRHRARMRRRNRSRTARKRLAALRRQTEQETRP